MNRMIALRMHFVGKRTLSLEESLEIELIEYSNPEGRDLASTLLE